MSLSKYLIIGVGLAVTTAGVLYLTKKPKRKENWLDKKLKEE
jgi:hypothetical protein